MGHLEKNHHHTDFKKIRQYCIKHHIKLTPLREHILKIVSQSNKPITAYAILDELRLINPKAQVMSVYRVLTFLLDNALIHRIESLNAVMLCHHMGNQTHTSQWLICDQCGHATEYDLPLFKEKLDNLVEQTGFKVTTPIIELSGICATCQQIRT